MSRMVPLVVQSKNYNAFASAAALNLAKFHTFGTSLDGYLLHTKKYLQLFFTAG